MKKKILLFAMLLVVIFSFAKYEAEAVSADLHTIQFSGETTGGETIDSGIFKDSKITMINVWATSCSACIKEMPDLQALYEEYRDQDVNIIGVVKDATDAERVRLAQKIIRDSGVTFDNILPSDSLNSGLLKNIRAYPTTVFVDSNGNIVGRTIIGASVANYEREIKNLLR